MATFNTPSAIRPLEKLIMDFSHANGHGPLNVFNDFLTYIIHGFSPGAPPLKSWKYKRRQNAAFMEMTYEWTRVMHRRIQNDTDWYDPFGDLYMSISSHNAKQSQGQYFTPEHICNFMVLCTDVGEKKSGQRMNDPACGSGRLLLAYHVRHLGSYLVGEDINRTCCLMTVCNMLMHGCIGEVIWHDSLRPEQFMQGWKINSLLTRTGIPTIHRMKEDEYRMSRNMPSHHPVLPFRTNPGLDMDYIESFIGVLAY